MTHEYAGRVLSTAETGDDTGLYLSDDPRSTLAARVQYDLVRQRSNWVRLRYAVGDDPEVVLEGGLDVSYGDVGNERDGYEWDSGWLSLAGHDVLEALRARVNETARISITYPGSLAGAPHG